MANLNLPMGAPPPENLNDVAFTRPEIVDRCAAAFRAAAEKEGLGLSVVRWIEPSAGDGAFLRVMPPLDTIALDIKPRAKGIERANFLEWQPPAGRRNVILGNPPFGDNGWLALEFLNHALGMADLVGFILPMGFSGLESAACLAWKVDKGGIVHEEHLPVNAFRDGAGNGNSFNIRTIFQVWSAYAPRPTPPRDFDVSDYVEFGSLDRARKNPDHWDCYVPTAFFPTCAEKAQVVFNPDETLYGGGTAVRIVHGSPEVKRLIIKLLVDTKWLDYCQHAVNNSCHIRKYDIRRRLGEHGYGKPYAPTRPVR